MDDPEHTLARLEADRSEIEVILSRYDYQRRYGQLLRTEEAIYHWLRQRSADLSSQIDEMQRHTDLDAEPRPTSPAAYRRWVNRYGLGT